MFICGIILTIIIKTSHGSRWCDRLEERLNIEEKTLNPRKFFDTLVQRFAYLLVYMALILKIL